MELTIDEEENHVVKAGALSLPLAQRPEHLLGHENQGENPHDGEQGLEELTENVAVQSLEHRTGPCRQKSAILARHAGRLQRCALSA